MIPITNISQVENGTKFTARIKHRYVQGVIHIKEGAMKDTRGIVYLCQNEFEGSNAFDKHGYKYSWMAHYDDEGNIRWSSENVSEVYLGHATVENPITLNPQLLFPGSSFVGTIKGVKIDGVIHSDGNSVYLCYNTEEALSGDRTSNMHGYTKSWYIGDTEDSADHLIRFPSRGAVVTEYTPHHLFIEHHLLLSKLEINENRSEEEYTNAKSAALKFIEEFSRPRKGFGYNIHYMSDGSIAFGCGEVTVTPEEVGGFVKIMEALQYRDFASKEQLQQAIDLSKRLIKKY